MGQRLVMSTDTWDALRAHLLSDQNEHFAFLLAGYGNHGGNHVLLAREIILVSDKALEWVEQTGGLSLHLDTLLSIINTASRKGLVIC